MPLNRRDFLKSSAAAGSFCFLPVSAPVRAAAQSGDWQSPQRSPADYYVPQSPSLTLQERQFVEAAVDRLIPEDELGPGAVRAGVPDFIDYQLGGGYGRAARWYMEGPWPDGSEAQGYQLRLTPLELYRHAIPLINRFCLENHQQKAFHELDGATRDQLLEQLSKGEIPLDINDPKIFFDMLWQNTREGFFADPMYGGNRDFSGWRLIGFPGPRYDYGPFITDYGKKYPYPPVGILGRKGIPLKELG